MDNYEVHTALGAKEALLTLSQIEKLDLILLDMRMEEFSGTDFLLELERTKPEIFEKVPIVFLTALDRIPSSKAIGFIRKPFDIDYFLDRVRSFVEAGPNGAVKSTVKRNEITSRSSAPYSGLQ